jgi:hypothetical protein
MVALLIGIVIGFFTGLLVYRNNAAIAKDIELKARAEYEADKTAAKNILAELNKK